MDLEPIRIKIQFDDQATKDLDKSLKETTKESKVTGNAISKALGVIAPQAGIASRAVLSLGKVLGGLAAPVAAALVPLAVATAAVIAYAKTTDQAAFAWSRVRSETFGAAQAAGRFGSAIVDAIGRLVNFSGIMQGIADGINAAADALGIPQTQSLNFRKEQLQLAQQLGQLQGQEIQALQLENQLAKDAIQLSQGKSQAEKDELKGIQDRITARKQELVAINKRFTITALFFNQEIERLNVLGLEERALDRQTGLKIQQLDKQRELKEITEEMYKGAVSNEERILGLRIQNLRAQREAENRARARQTALALGGPTAGISALVPIDVTSNFGKSYREIFQTLGEEIRKIDRLLSEELQPAVRDRLEAEREDLLFIRQQGDALKDMISPLRTLVEQRDRLLIAATQIADLSKEEVDAAKAMTVTLTKQIQLEQQRLRIKSVIGDIGLEAVDTLDQGVAEGISSGIRSSIDNRSFSGFTKTFGESLYNTTITALTQAFIQSLGLQKLFSSILGGTGGAGGGGGLLGIFSQIGGLFASHGGMVTNRGILRMAGGGVVPSYGRPFADSVPAILMPGERVLSQAQNRRYEEGMMAGPTIAFTANINTIDTGTMKEAVLGVIPEIETALANAYERNSAQRKAQMGR